MPLPTSGRRGNVLKRPQTFQGLLAFGRLARPRVWSCNRAQSCAIAQWLNSTAAPTPRTQTKYVHEFYCTGGKWQGNQGGYMLSNYHSCFKMWLYTYHSIICSIIIISISMIIISTTIISSSISIMVIIITITIIIIRMIIIITTIIISTISTSITIIIMLLYSIYNI